jgi:hypothetical protein
MGLNSTKMAHADAIKRGPRAHAAFNKGVFYELAPDILMPAAFPADRPAKLGQVRDYYCDTRSWDNIIFKNLFNDDRFKRSYSLAMVASGREPRYKCCGFFSSAFLARLRERGFIIEDVLRY